MCIVYTTDRSLLNKPAALKKGKHIQIRCPVLLLDSLVHLFCYVNTLKQRVACMLVNFNAYTCVRSIYVLLYFLTKVITGIV